MKKNNLGIHILCHNDVVHFVLHLNYNFQYELTNIFLLLFFNDVVIKYIYFNTMLNIFFQSKKKLFMLTFHTIFFRNILSVFLAKLIIMTLL